MIAAGFCDLLLWHETNKKSRLRRKKTAPATNSERIGRRTFLLKMVMDSGWLVCAIVGGGYTFDALKHSIETDSAAKSTFFGKQVDGALLQPSFGKKACRLVDSELVDIALKVHSMASHDGAG